MEELNYGKSSRVLHLYTMLLRGQVLRKDKLAQQFGVNEKSIQRDLETIREFLDREKMEEGYGAQLIYDFQMRGYRLDEDEQQNLSLEETLAVSKILLASRAFTKKEMMNILDKLIRNCISVENRRLINGLLENEKYHYVELQHHKVFLDKLMPLGQAIRECRLIRIKYGKLKEKNAVERKLEPLAILFSEYYFYLVAFIEDGKKETAESVNDRFPAIYRIDRIGELEVLEEHFKIPYANRFEEGEFRKRIQFMYGGKLKKIRFCYQGESVEAVLDRLPTAKVIKTENKTHWIEAEVFGQGVDMWIRSQGESITEYAEV
ncbi:MAG: WYL domain-containing protein [Clostridium sp.]|nr:WYL domain-containing protein [Clostridium sp.]